jgi:hypothetical protein
MLRSLKRFVCLSTVLSLIRVYKIISTRTSADAITTPHVATHDRGVVIMRET